MTVANRVSRGLLIGTLTVASSALGPSPAAAQQPSLRLRMVSPPVQPKARVFVNAILSNPTGEQVAQVYQSLTFSQAELEFIRARLAIAGDAAGATLTVEMQDASGATVEDPQKAERLEVTIAAKKPLPGGPLAEFQFRAPSEKEQSIRVRHVAEARDPQGQTLSALAFSDVHVTVTKKPGLQPLKVFACFFYMH